MEVLRTENGLVPNNRESHFSDTTRSQGNRNSCGTRRVVSSVAAAWAELIMAEEADSTVDLLDTPRIMQVSDWSSLVLSEER